MIFINCFWIILGCLASTNIVDSCMASGRVTTRSQRGAEEDNSILVYKEYRPNKPEESITASGPPRGIISRGSERFKDELIINTNQDIKFRDHEKTGADRYMTKRCKEKLDILSLMVLNKWPDVKLRVIEGWDEDMEHKSGSLHYEGRAVDFNLSDRDRRKLSVLALLAYQAGFDWVKFEGKGYIHASVKADSDVEETSPEAYGCFALEDNFVKLSDGTNKLIRDLKIGDHVQAATRTGHSTTENIITFLHREQTAPKTFIRISTESTNITLTPTHLLYHSEQEAPTYASDINLDQYLLVNKNGTISMEKVTMVSRVRMRGFAAPLTASGTLFVNDVYASCYSAVPNHVVAHASMWPLRWYAWIQKQFVGDWWPNAETADGINVYAKFLYTYFGYFYGI